MTYAVFPAGGGGSGDVQGPITSVDNGVVLFNGTSGKVIKDLGVGSANQVLKTDGSAPSFGLIVNANVDGSAGIELSKLAALTASRALVSNGSGFVSASAVTSTELGYLSGVTSSIQTQLSTNASNIATNASDILDRVLTAGDTMTGQLIINTTSNQLQLRTGTNALTVNAGTSAAARTYTVPDGGTIANFVIDQGASTFNGARTFTAKSVHEAGVQIGITGASYSIGFVAPVADRTINLQDPGGTANFVLSEGTQTLGGTYTFSNTITGDISGNAGTVTNGAYVNVSNTFTQAQTISAASNQVVLSSGVNQLTLNSGTSAAARTYTVPDVGTSADFVMTAGAQTIAGVKTFTSSTRIQNGGASLIIGADLSASTLTNATRKYAYIAVPPYTNSEENILFAQVETDTAFNAIRYGGGDANYNAATEHRWYTAANATTVTGTERMRLDSAGNFGIGTTSPNALQENVGGASATLTNLLELRSNFSTTGTATGIGFYNSSSAGGLFGAGRIYVERDSTAVTGTMVLQGSSSGTFTDGVTIAGNGNVGIGASSPSGGISGTERFVAVENSNVAGISFDTTGGVTNTKWSAYTLNSTGTFNIRNVDGAVTAFSATPSGVVNLGPSGPTAITHQINGGAKFDCASSVSVGAYRRTASTTAYLLFLESNVGGTQQLKWRVEADGDTISSTGSYTSDLRAKKNIVPIHYGLSEILQLDPMSFHWNHDDDSEVKSFSLGSAQQVEKIMPEMVRDDGLDDGEGGAYKAVYEKEVIAVMVKAIQELKAELDAVKAS